jgi:hypothetical protein
MLDNKMNKMLAPLLRNSRARRKKIFISPYRKPPITQFRFLQSRRREFLRSHCGILPPATFFCSLNIPAFIASSAGNYCPTLI